MNTARSGRTLLAIGGTMNAAVALLHIGIMLAGAPAYRYFGAGEKMARMAEAGSIVPAVVTSTLALVFMVFAFYAFSAAGIMRRRLPFLRPIVVGIGIVYVLRGLMIIPVVAAVWMQRSVMVEARGVVFSLAAAVIGVFYLAGVRMNAASMKSASAKEAVM